MGHLFEKREDLPPLPRQLSLWKEGWGSRGDGEGRGEKNKEQKSPAAFMEGIFDFSRILFIPCKTNSGAAFSSTLRLPPPSSLRPPRWHPPSQVVARRLTSSSVCLHQLFSFLALLLPLFLFPSPDKAATSSQTSARNAPPIRGLQDPGTLWVEHSQGAQWNETVASA